MLMFRNPDYSYALHFARRNGSKLAAFPLADVENHGKGLKAGGVKPALFGALNIKMQERNSQMGDIAKWAASGPVNP
jgi:hypothetical protein